MDHFGALIKMLGCKITQKRTLFICDSPIWLAQLSKAILIYQSTETVFLKRALEWLLTAHGLNLNILNANGPINVFNKNDKDIKTCYFR